MSQSCFSLRFFSQNLSRSYLQYVGIRGIYIGVCLDAKGQVCNKQNGLAAWPHDLTKSRV